VRNAHHVASGERLTASEMVRGVLEVASDLEFDRVSLGFPGLVEQGKPVLEPRNFGDEWVGFYRCGSDLIKLARKEPLVDRLSKAALERDGNERWKEAVVEAEELLQSVFKPDETVLGGGNAKLVDPLPANCRCVDNDPPTSACNDCGKAPTSSQAHAPPHGESIATRHTFDIDRNSTSQITGGFSHIR
jgi:hypothetical protein